MLAGTPAAALKVTLCVIALNMKETVPPRAISTCAGLKEKAGAEIVAALGNVAEATITVPHPLLDGSKEEVAHTWVPPVTATPAARPVALTVTFVTSADAHDTPVGGLPVPLTLAVNCTF